MAANYVLLGTQTVGNGGAQTVTFSNIPQSGYTDLKVVISGRTTRNNADPGSDVGIAFNGSSTGYYNKTVAGDGSNPSSGTASNTPYFTATLVTSSYATADTFGVIELYVPNYTSSNKKAVNIQSFTETNATTSFMRTIAGTWDNTAAISSMSFTETNGFAFVANSTFSLYGLAAVGTTPAIAPLASGGNIIANDGTYWYHAFRSNGTFKFNKATPCDVLIVAGGGSGGSGNGHIGGGGGAGGVVYLTNQSLGTTPTAVTIGAGATGRNSASSGPNISGGGSGYKGSNSSVGSLTVAIGGGYGAAGATSGTGIAGGPGGSGGGASHWDYNGAVSGGSATSGQGNAGGKTTGFGSGRSGGGGGGAGAAGGNGSGNVGAAGGAGTNAYSSMLSAVSLGVSGYIAGGGGGGSDGQPQNFAGGSGGGGTGYYSGTNGGNGVANTGSGGGACSYMTSGAGGSGLVIIRYAMA